MSDINFPTADLEAASNVVTASPARSHVGRWMGVIVVALVAGLIGLTFLQSEGFQRTASDTGPVGTAIEVGALAPDFSLTSLTGEPVRLSDFRGRPVVLNFWATWCSPCLKEMPALEQIWQQGGAGNVVVLGVDQGESIQRVQSFVEDKVDISFPILLDSDHRVGNTYLVRALPTTLFIDDSGLIHEIRIGGPLSLAFLQDRVAKLQTQ